MKTLLGGWIGVLMALQVTACGERVYKCVFERKGSSGAWEKRCQTFYEEDVVDIDTFCDKYEGRKTPSVKPSDTVYSTSAEYRNSRREEVVCGPEDGEEI